MLIAPALPLALIHPTAWKWNSPKFAGTEFSEVQPRWWGMGGESAPFFLRSTAP